MNKILVILSLCLGLSVAGASETIKGAKKDYQKFQQEMTSRLDNIEKEIQLLKEKAKDKKEATQEKTIHELEEAKTELKAELQSLKADSESTWQKAKKSFAESVDNLNTKLQKALKN